jgi:hypothetical protein
MAGAHDRSRLAERPERSRIDHLTGLDIDDLLCRAESETIS